MKRIVPYIPLSCSLTWLERDSSLIPPVNIHTSFSPSWFAKRMDLDYGESWHTDPAVRRESFISMAGVLSEEFPELRKGFERKDIRGSISQAYTCSLMASLFGQEIIFRKSDWPDNRGKHLTDEEAESLSVPDFPSHPVFKDIVRQIALIRKKWGRGEGVLNYQGVLNTAFRLRGQDVFLDMIDAPARAQRLLGTVCDTTMAVVDAVYAEQRKSGVSRNHFVTSNCVVNMISSEQYKRFVLPYDSLLSRHYDFFGIHNCGWPVDEYIDAYGTIANMGYLDFGIESDFKRIRKTFGSAVTFCPIFNPSDLANRSDGEIVGILESIHRDLGECQIILGGLDDTVSVRIVADFFEHVAKIWNVPVATLPPDIPDSF
jgi:hypothetical protein